MKIKIISKSIGEVVVELTDENPKTALEFFDALPIEGKAHLWGDEIYFSMPMQVEKENSRTVVKEGEIAVWIENPSLCIFFGKTPVSTDTEIRAYSEVNVIGQTLANARIFLKIDRGDVIRIERIDE